MAKPADRSPNQETRQSTKLPQWAPPALFLTLALWVGSLVYDRAFSSYDDGVAAEGARLILHGGVPYRDFWTVYAPGSFYLSALGLALLGERLISIRLLGLLAGVAQAALFYGIVARTVRNTAAAVACAAIFLALIPLEPRTYWLAAAMAAVYSLVRFVDSPGSRWCYLCGFFSALTLLFRQDGGAYLAIAVFPLIFFTTPAQGTSRLVPVAKAAAVFAAVLASAVGYLAANGALSPMIDSAVRFAVLGFPESRTLPYPVPWREVLVIGQYSAPLSVAFLYQLYGFYLLPAALLLFGGHFVRRLLRNDCDRSQLILALLICVALLMFLMVRVRPSGARIVVSAALGAVAFAGMAVDRSRAVRLAGIAMLAGSVVAFVPFAAYTIWAQRSYATSVITGRGGVYAARGHAELLSIASAKIKEITSPSERILCGTPAIYFLSSRHPATRYYEPHPCVTDTPEVQRAIISDIEKNHVRYFVRSREWGSDSYFTIEPEHQPRMLTDYIDAHYAARYDYVLFQIYERKAPFRASRR